MGVFKTYDIRGVYGAEIDEALAWRIGRALARHLRATKFLLAYDARLHSPSLYRALASGLLQERARVEGIGLATTPQLHFTQIHRGFEAGVMVTASHNPPQYHGFKVYDATGGSVSYEKGLDRVEALLPSITAPAGPTPTGVPSATFPESDSVAEYVDFVIEKAAADSPPMGRASASPQRRTAVPPGYRAVVDASNGAAGRVFTRLVEKLGMEAVVINAEPDGRFPAHDPNPLKPESKRQVSGAVLERKADFGVVLDGDGDRILFVDERGNGIENYFLACLVAEEILSSSPGAAIVYDLISSRVLPERVRELGGTPVVSKVGYTFLYDRMVESKALFGAETSGHVYFKVTDRYYTESAAWALVVLARLLSRRREPLSKLVAPLAARYAQSPEINLEVEDKARAMERVAREFAGGRIERLDGISVEFPDFWFNLRPSNTEPLLRLRLEARSPEIASARAEEIRRLLAR